MKKIPMLLFSLAMGMAVMLGVSSCDDGNLLPHTIIEGKVLEYGTKEPIENAQVILYEQTAAGTFSTSDMPIDTVITDAMGSYHFQYNGKGQAGVKAFHDTYFPISRVPYENIYYKQRNVENIILDPYALLELHIKNVNPFDGNDNVRYSGHWDGGSPQDNLGMDVDFYDTKTVRGNRGIPISWRVIKNNNISQHRDTIYCKGNGTTRYELFY